MGFFKTEMRSILRFFVHFKLNQKQIIHFFSFIKCAEKNKTKRKINLFKPVKVENARLGSMALILVLYVLIISKSDVRKLKFFLKLCVSCPFW